MKQLQTIHHHKGVSLVECLVSVLILSIGLIAGMRCMEMALLAHKNTYSTAAAVVNAQAELETIRSLKVTNYMANMDANVTNNIATKATLADGSAQYTEQLVNIVPRLPIDVLQALPLATIVINPNAKPFPNATAGSNEDNMNKKMYKATVTVSWTGIIARSKSATLVTFVIN